MLISFHCRSLIKSVSQQRRAYWQLKWSTAKKLKQVKLKKRERSCKDEIEILITLWITLYEERPCLLDVGPKDYIKAGVNMKAVFWLGITFLTQISRWRFKQSRIFLLISHIYVLG